jgi:hypothetical protein
VAGTVTSEGTVPAIRRVFRNHGLAIGRRIAAVFIDPIENLFYVPERDAIVLWTRTFNGRGITRNLYCYSGRGKRLWQVGPAGEGPNGDRYHDAGVWSETKLLAWSFKGFTVVDFVSGAVISRVGR